MEPLWTLSPLPSTEIIIILNFGFIIFLIVFILLSV